MATAFTLNPGESANWSMIVAFHTGAYAKGEMIYSNAAASDRYSISGRVTDAEENPIPGVLISANTVHSHPQMPVVITP